ncbi:UDP-N-acetylmuramyl-tripeptide synthetase [Candidatus Kaiserbacteria bacterium]|nr:UDP-N-acetylmuramyl-tripeptide synthetase [Candidatus Kaiserbacteria bacterium]
MPQSPARPRSERRGHQGPARGGSAQARLPHSRMIGLLRKIIPAPLLSAYHLVLAHAGAVVYRFPSRELVVVAVTGTKGKSTTVELVAELLRVSGKKTASASTIRFCIDGVCERNLYKMTMPGRFFLQRFLRRAVDAGCTHVVVEMTSEGALQHRHKGVELNALVFTNLQPEHLERHGGMEGYAAAKLSLAEHVANSPKRPRIIVANSDDKYGQKFLEIEADLKAPYSLADAEPYNTDDKNVRFVWRGELFTVPLPGVFNVYNCLAALTLGDALGLKKDDMKRALEHLPPIAGRQERVECGQPFAVVVDYAHTPDSLRALFEAYTSTTLSTGKNKRIIAVIGSTGGGRDTWNRPEKGKIAEQYCDVVYIANEDPYDEDPQQILTAIAKGFSIKTPHLTLDRRAAIAAALKEAREGDAILITGKGTDPYIMGPRGSKQVWSDAGVAGEELKKLGYN